MGPLVVSFRRDITVTESSSTQRQEMLCTGKSSLLSQLTRRPMESMCQSTRSLCIHNRTHECARVSESSRSLSIRTPHSVRGVWAASVTFGKGVGKQGQTEGQNLIQPCPTLKSKPEEQPGTMERDLQVDSHEPVLTQNPEAQPPAFLGLLRHLG